MIRLRSTDSILANSLNKPIAKRSRGAVEFSHMDIGLSKMFRKDVKDLIPPG